MPSKIFRSWAWYVGRYFYSLKNKAIIVKERLYSFQVRWQRKLPDAFSSVPFFFFPRTLLETETKKKNNWIVCCHELEKVVKSESLARTQTLRPLNFAFRCSVLHAARCTLHAARCTLHAARYTLHAARCTLHVARCTLYFVPSL